MDPLLGCLTQLGLGVAANAVYDYLKRRFGDTPEAAIDTRTIEAGLKNIIELHRVNVMAATVIDALARNGFIVIRGSRLHGPEGLAFGSTRGAAVAGDNTRLSTDRTAIDIGVGAFMTAEGNAQVRQNPDGSISFHVGE